MNYIQRILDLSTLLNSRSVLLLGPRQSGKSTYIKHQLSVPISASYNLLNQSTYLQLSHDQTRIRQEVLGNKWQGGLIVIDEIQKIPQLLDEVHLMIEDLQVRFLLTGSSARKLKSSDVNLLGGRARMRNLHPLVYKELGNNFDLTKAMYNGLLPQHYFSDLIDDDLAAYIGLYLNEEIKAEGLSRNIPGFARFLEVAATCNTQMLNFTSVASDAQISRQTIQNYFQILVDTLLGFYLPPFEETLKRKTTHTNKFYFFDMGIVRALRRLGEISKQSNDFGGFFEHFIFLELKAYISYKKPQSILSYWQSKSGFEVDFLLDKKLAIEVKSSTNISDKHLRGLKALAQENIIKTSIIVCFEENKRKIGDILIYPWKVFLEELWNGDFDY